MEKKVKAIDSDIFLEQQLKKEEFRKEYELLEEEFEIAKQIIKFRKSKNMTQKELAILAETSQPAIARLESGEYKNLSLKFLRKIAKVFDMIPEVHFKKI
jgi:DNA-binding XRE family transcriptional regulator